MLVRAPAIYVFSNNFERVWSGLTQTALFRFIKNLAFEDQKVKGYIAGKEIKKVIVVPKKLVNIVV